MNGLLDKLRLLSAKQMGLALRVWSHYLTDGFCDDVVIAS